MKLNFKLIGPNIHLKTLNPDDLGSAYFRWFSDEAIMRFLEVRYNPPKSLFELASFVASVNESEDSVLAGIFLNSTLAHIGNIKIGSINKIHASADIGYLLGDRSAWGKGYATQAIKLIVDYAFSDLALLKITAGCIQGNEGSKKALIKSGFLQEGLLLQQLVVDDQRRDVYQMGILNPVLNLVS